MDSVLPHFRKPARRSGSIPRPSRSAAAPSCGIEVQFPVRERASGDYSSHAAAKAARAKARHRTKQRASPCIPRQRQRKKTRTASAWRAPTGAQNVAEYERRFSFLWKSENGSFLLARQKERTGVSSYLSARRKRKGGVGCVPFGKTKGKNWCQFVPFAREREKAVSGAYPQ